jgi:zinc transport system substrate-binding protein
MRRSRGENHLRTLSFFFILTIGIFASSAKAGDAPLTIYTVNYPLQYFAERIAGDHATVVFPAQADVDPAYWMPDKKTIAEYQKADLILLNGAKYAKWTEKVTLPRSRMVDTSRKFKDRYIHIQEIQTHSHGPGGKHAHESLAFTTWIDFSLAAQQAEAIMKALSRKRPDLKNTFEQNYTDLEKDLMALDKGIMEIASQDQNRPLVVSHPVYDYLSRRYGLNIRSVHWEPDEVPDEKQLFELKRIRKEHPAQWMIWEGDPDQTSVERLESMEIKSIVFDPCGNVPSQGNFLSKMRQNVENFREVFE